jgi:hypothetical protein
VTAALTSGTNPAQFVFVTTTEDEAGVRTAFRHRFGCLEANARGIGGWWETLERGIAALAFAGSQCSQRCAFFRNSWRSAGLKLANF